MTTTGRSKTKDINELKAEEFSSGQEPLWDGSKFGPVNRGAASNTNTVIVDVGGKGDYDSVKDACDYVATQGRASATPWQIVIYPGQYVEAAFTIPTYTTVYGFGNRTEANPVFITDDGTFVSGTFITMGDESVLRGVKVVMTNTPTGVVVGIDCTSNCVIQDCYINITGGGPAPYYDFTGVKFSGLFAESQLIDSYVYGNRIASTGWGVVVASTVIAINSEIWGNSVGVKVTSAVITLYRCEVDSDTLDIDNPADVVGLWHTKYESSSGTITHMDLATTTIPGLIYKDSAIANMGITGTAAYSQAQMDALIGKVDDILAAARTSKWLAT